MSEHGFRKFSRRKTNGAREPGQQPFGRRGLSAETEAVRALPSASDRIPDARDEILLTLEETSHQLPSPLPDPWDSLKKVSVDGKSKRRRLPLVDFFRGSVAARSFDLLRTRLLHGLRDHGWRRVAICAPTARCGASFTAVNLAQSLARVSDTRTLLLDMNLRKPGVAQALGLERQAVHAGDMRGFLAGEQRLEDHLLSVSDGLAVGLNATATDKSSEILHETRTADTITDAIHRLEADVVLFDLPPVLETDDVAAFLPQVDGILLIADATRTTAADLKACERIIGEQVPLLGVMLNRARKRDTLLT